LGIAWTSASGRPNTGAATKRNPAPAWASAIFALSVAEEGRRNRYNVLAGT